MEVPCDFSDDSASYKCFVYNVDIASPQRITKFIGEHAECKTNADVVSVSFIDCGIKSLPRNLAKIFPKLQVIELISCDLKELTKEDLIAYSNLFYLGLVGNHLTHLPSDLFEYTPDIQYIDFSCNQISSIGPRLFDSLTILRHANFSHNRTIDAFYEEDAELSFDEFLGMIKESCRPLESLKGISATKLTELINDENAAEIFMYSCRSGLVGLKRKAFLYMKENLMPSLDEKLVDQPGKLIGMMAMKKWGFFGEA